MLSKWIALAALVTAPLPLLAQSMADAVTEYELDNGMQVIVVEDRRAPVVQHMVWYRAGSADEPPGKSGIAHFLEHLMFKGTETTGPGEFSSVVAANGGRDNAFTSYDYTAYFQRVAADRLELMMQMEADRMVNLRLTENEVETERQVILEERNQRLENNPRALFSEQMNAAQYINHRYGIPIIGWKHEMEDLSLQDAQDFYDQHYAPNNAVLIVTGDVEPEEVLALAEKHYGAIPANPDIVARARPQDPPHTAERRLFFRDARVAQPYLMRSYTAPERDSGDQEKAAALALLASVLGSGPTSFLSERLEFDAQIATFTGAFYRGVSLDDTAFDIIVVPADGVSLEEAEAAMDRALEAFIETGVDAEQLDRIKMQLRASQIYALDSATGIGNRYGRALTSGLTVADIEAWPDILQAVTGEDIVAAARAVLRPEASVTGYLMREEEVLQ
jgi:zinc protease